MTRPAPLTDLVGLLRLLASEAPHHVVYVHLVDGEEEALALSHAQLERRARAIAVGLQETVGAGERALLLHPPGLEFVAALFGCLFADVIAVPAYPPVPQLVNRTLPRLRTIAEDAAISAVLTDSALGAALDLTCPEVREALPVPWIATDRLRNGLGDDWEAPPVHSESIALLQYTSGSTASPKGVILTHANLLAQLEVLQHALGPMGHTHGVSWLPPYHDMGLIGGLLYPLYARFPVTIFSPISFLQKPIRWLRALSRTQATITVAPNFGFELAMRKSSPADRSELDLSALQVALCGGEPIDHGTRRRFIEAFTPCGLRPETFTPCYGLAEAALMVSGRARGAKTVVREVSRAKLEGGRIEGASPGESTRTLVGCGTADHGTRVRVVDPQTRIACPDGTRGEIWVAGRSVAQGYWNRRSETRETFEVYLADTAEGPFLRTGDLGCLEGAELFVTGRIKDLIVLRGRNLHPEDIEAVVGRSHPAVRPGSGAAFPLMEGGTERLGIAVEVNEQPDLDLEDVIVAVRRAVAESHEVAPHCVALLQPRTIPKTSSGKIQRSAVREALEAGTLELLAEWREPLQQGTESELQASAPPKATAAPKRAGSRRRPDATSEEIAAWLVTRLARRLGLPRDRIDVERPLVDYGLDSVEAVAVASELEVWLARPVSPALAWEFPSIARLARHLGAGGSGARPARQQRTAPSSESVAIVGYGCRFPGAPDPESFWELLQRGGDGIVDVPPDRWDVERFFDPKPGTPGKIVTSCGGFLPDIDRFDPTFFGIAPREAHWMDPQQRLLLEVTWEALENAAIAPRRIAGTRSGVFIGIGGIDYAFLMKQLADARSITPYVGTGNAHSIAANRISYLLDLRGPSLAVDTACSSSLVSIHLACQSLRSGESDLALAGGANAILSPEVSLAFSQARMLSPAGRCRTFDADADGYVRSEGCGMVVLKRLSDALRDRDSIRGVIRGIAVNQDGRTPGITVPRKDAQCSVVREALDQAGVRPEDISYVEAHGTGTSIGDPIEMSALAEVLGTPDGAADPCRVGSVKANIGHLETASGVAGLIKMLLCLEREEIPAQIHLKQLNPHLALDKTRLVIPTEKNPWRRGARPRLATVSSFGFGGTNAHLILEEAPLPSRVEGGCERTAHLFTLSARGERMLREVASRFVAWIDRHPGAPLADVCFSANVGRNAQPYSLAVTAESLAQLRQRLSAFVAGEPAVGLRTGKPPTKDRPRIAFLFTGQGAQHTGMARTLYETQPAFRSALDRCATILEPLLPKPLLGVLFGPDDDSSPLHQTAFTQPALFSVEVALAALWRSWGIEPDLVLGHSVGEYAAGCVSGALDLEDGLRLIAERGRCMQAVRSDGAMAALHADAERVQDVLQSVGGSVAIAAINGPTNTVISGDREQVARILEKLGAEGVRGRHLEVSHAFHSPLIEPCLDEFEASLRGVSCRLPDIPLVSNLTGAVLKEPPDAAHWRRHAREHVRFAEGMATLFAEGCRVFLEVGPHPTLLGMGRTCVTDSEVSWIPSLRRGIPDWSVLLDSLAQLHLRGFPVDWESFDAEYERSRIALPTSPFDRGRYWIDEVVPGGSKAGGPSAADPAGSDVLPGRRLRSALDMTQFELRLDRNAFPYLGDHCVQGATVVPAAFYLDLALRAGREVFGDEVAALSDVTFQQGLLLPEEGARTVQVVVYPCSGGEAMFQIFALAQERAEAGARWIQHCAGRIRVSQGEAPTGACSDPSSLQQGLAVRHEADAVYREFRGRGLEYGPSFRTLREIWSRDGESLARVSLAEGIEEGATGTAIHPTLLDGCFQALAAALPAAEVEASRGAAYLPMGVEEFRVAASGPAQAWSHCTIRNLEGGGIVADTRLLDEHGRELAAARGLSLVRFGGSATQSIDELLYRVVWEEARPPTTNQQRPGRWWILADASGVGERIAGELARSDAELTLVFAENSFEELGPGRFAIDPARRADFDRLAGELRREDAPPPRVAFLWGLDVDPPEEATEAWLERAGILTTEAVLQLCQAVRATGGTMPERFALVTRAAQRMDSDAGALQVLQAPLWGLGRAMRMEEPELGCICIDLGAEASDPEIRALAGELLGEQQEDMIALRDDRRYVARLVRAGLGDEQHEGEAAELPLPATESYRLESSKPGDLGALRFRPQRRTSPPEGALEIEVGAAGLNFRDVLNAMGLYPGGPIPYGGECAGRVSAVGASVDGLEVGDEVIAIAPASFARYALTSVELVAKKPPELSFEQAATIPVVFLTAHYGLNELARMQRGERVLIHAAAGGVGLAAVQLAHRAGAEVFATAGSPEKREFLHALGVHWVGDSRSLDFADQILEETRGRGVDIVLNSLPGEAIARSLATLGAHGRFVEIGRTDIYQNRQIGLLPFRNNLSYFAIDLEKVCRERAGRVQAMLSELMRDFREGVLQPLPSRTFHASEIVEAFRHMARRRNVGKIVIAMQPRQAEPACAQGTTIRSDGSYLITGGCGGIGLALAQWLAEQGAGAIALLGRTGASPEGRQRLDGLGTAGVRVEVLRADVADAAALEGALGEIRRRLPPLRGVFHAAGILENGLLRDLTVTQMRSVAGPKVRGGWNLHRATRGDRLDHFVLFSSAAAAIGAARQGNYAAANAFLPALARHRRASGLPALAVDFGAWAQVGMAVAPGVEQFLKACGNLLMPPRRALAALERLLRSSEVETVVADFDWPRVVATAGAGRCTGLLSSLAASVEQSEATGGSDSRRSELAGQILTLEGSERLAAICEGVRRELARLTGLALSDIDPSLPLPALGLDSLMVLELKERLESTLGVRLGFDKLVEDPTIHDLGLVLLDGLSAREG